MYNLGLKRLIDRETQPTGEEERQESSGRERESLDTETEKDREIDRY